MKIRPIIIDTDPGIDDAAAICMAVKNERIDVRLITTVAGNVDLEKTTKNALRLVEFLNADIPIAKGMDRPLLRESVYADDVHGESGMEGYIFPEPLHKPLEQHAVEVLKDTLMKSEEKITLVTIAALTNIAVLLRMYPEVKEHIKEIVMMGGCLGKGNTNTASEFNIFVDPHAAKIVFESGIKITIVPLDVTREAKVYKESSEKIKKSGKVGEMLYSLFSHYRGGSLEKGLIIHDACAVAYLLKPELFVTEDMYIDVVTDGIAAGALVADGFMKQNKDKKPNVTICTAVDGRGFEELFTTEIAN